VFLKFFQKTEEERILPKTFSEATVILIPKPDKDTTKKKKKRKLQANIFDECRCKNSQQNISKLISTTHKKIIHHNHMGFIPSSQGWFNIHK